jgi:hypothetical protein
MKNKLSEPPKPPLCRIIREGCTHFCNKCHSSTPRRWVLIGKRYCLNPDCQNSYGYKEKE